MAMGGESFAGVPQVWVSRCFVYVCLLGPRGSLRLVVARQHLYIRCWF